MHNNIENTVRIPGRSLVGCYGWFLLMIVGSVFGGYLSMERAHFYTGLDPDNKRSLVISRTENLANRQILPDFRAFGFLANSQELINIEIYRKEFERLKPGDHIFVLKVPQRENEYVDFNRYKNNKPLFIIFGVPFAWHIFVILILFIVTAVALRDLLKKQGLERVEQARFIANIFYIKVVGGILALIGYALRP